MTSAKPEFIFFDLDAKVVAGYRSTLENKIVNAKFVVDDVRKIPQEYKIHAIVSPANSFGFMDGGIDKPLNVMFPKIDVKLRQMINFANFATTPRGLPYLPVGKCIMIETNNSTCPYMISAPTMYMPERITETDNVYKAFKSILNAHGNKKVTIACPGLGTLTGMMTPVDSALQILRAYNEYYGL